MLTRNCVTNLFKKNDSNVRISVLNKNPDNCLPKFYYNAWIDMIIDNLGEGMLNSQNEIIMVITRTNQEQTGYPIICTKIPDCVRANFSKPEPIRIDILKCGKQHSWIFLLEKSC